jgi:hypothetical protein
MVLIGQITVLFYRVNPRCWLGNAHILCQQRGKHHSLRRIWITINLFASIFE